MATHAFAHLPTHGAVLEGLRHVRLRQVVRHRHEPILDALVKMGFVRWAPEVTRQSQRPPRPTAADYRPSVEIAELTLTGHSALDWLNDLARSPWWDDLRWRPYGSRPIHDRAAAPLSLSLNKSKPDGMLQRPAEPARP